MAYIDLLLDTYQKKFDIETPSKKLGVDFAAFCSAPKKEAMPEKEKHTAYEQVFIVEEDNLTITRFLECTQMLYRWEQEMIKPGRHHKYTLLTLIFICKEHMDASFKTTFKQTKLHKNYCFSFHGWMHARIVGIDLKSGEIYHNFRGMKIAPLIRKCHNQWIAQ